MYAHNSTGKSPLPGIADNSGKVAQAAKPDTAAAAKIAANPDAGSDSVSVDMRQLESAVRKIEQSVQEVQRTLVFSIDEESGDHVITVVDRETQEVIRRIPQDEVVTVAERLGKGTASLLRLRA